MNDLIHAVAAFLLPPTGAFPLLLLAWWWRQRHRWLAGSLFAIGLLSVWVGSTELGATWLQDRLLGRQHAVNVAALKPKPNEAPDAMIVVLGAGARRLMPEYGSAQLKPLSIERLRYGIWLSRQTGIPVMFTGGAPRAMPNEDYTEAGLAQRTAALEFGFRLAAIEDRATDTRENAQFTAALLKDRPVRRVVLVTHDVHMRRALQAFRQALPPEVEIIPAPLGLPLPGYDWRDLLPSQDGIARARYLGYEWLGYIAGH
ncbi:YdcF family protein [Roseateles sp. So40a]|uniref:YdcF family protein n=1 Tax=Roseateles sp. So40a TaxID=3400226 RepID=UPI003A844ED8